MESGTLPAPTKTVEAQQKLGTITVDYRCSVCNAHVDVLQEPGKEAVIKWDCGHDGQKVIAWLSGTLRRVRPFKPGEM